MIFYLAFLLCMAAFIGRDAVLDRTPRRPFVWSRPGLSWWAAKRTPRERARTAIAIGEKQA